MHNWIVSSSQKDMANVEIELLVRVSVKRVIEKQSEEVKMDKNFKLYSTKRKTISWQNVSTTTTEKKEKKTTKKVDLLFPPLIDLIDGVKHRNSTPLNSFFFFFFSVFSFLFDCWSTLLDDNFGVPSAECRILFAFCVYVCMCVSFFLHIRRS